MSIALGIVAGPHGVCLVKATSTVVHLNEYTCECDSGFELKSTARVVAYQLPSTMSGTCPRTPFMCSACRVSPVTAESRNLQNDIRGQTASALRSESNQVTENIFCWQTAPAEQKAFHQQSAARRGAQVANATRRGVRGGAREVDGPNTDVGLHSGTVLVRHAG